MSLRSHGHTAAQQVDSSESDFASAPRGWFGRILHGFCRVQGKVVGETQDLVSNSDRLAPENRVFLNNDGNREETPDCMAEDAVASELLSAINRKIYREISARKPQNLFQKCRAASAESESVETRGADHRPGS